jgi:hypothetical protein
MKFIKMLGLVAAAAMAAMALVGASSASATVLCKVAPTENKCPAGSTYGAGTVIKGTTEVATLTSPAGNVTCHSETEAKTANAGGAAETVKGEITALSFNNCVLDPLKTECTVETNNLPYNAEVHWTSGTNNGTLTVEKHAGGGNPGATVTCAGVIECTFSNTLFNLPVTGGNPATVTANEVTLLREGGLCPSTAKWDATYKAIGVNVAIWVAKE